MPTERVNMRKIRELLRLKHEAGLSHERIALACSLSKGVVSKYVRRFALSGLSWPLPASMDDRQLEAALLGSTPPADAQLGYMPLDYATLDASLRHKGVTRLLLWQEYRQNQAGRYYSYTQFCVHYRCWKARQPLSMRQVHQAGEKLFIDYCGPTVGVVDSGTGEVRQAAIFVAVWGVSSATYVEATWTQSLPDWIGAHGRMFDYFGGVPALLIPDNLKAGVHKACRYEPELNPTYADLAAHYSCAVLPARPYKPKDKAKVEVGVQIVERWVLARLRHHLFHSLAELNAAISHLLQHLNHKPFKKRPGTRWSVFEHEDRPALKPLPPQRYEYAQWKKARVNIDYHVELDGHYYSVPHALVKQLIEIRHTEHTVECFYQHQRVASHVRSTRQSAHSTQTDHMPKSHQKHMQWTPGRFLNWAKDIGPHTLQLVQHVLEHKPHPEHGYRTCLGLLNLTKPYGAPRLEAACARAMALGSPTRKSVLSILEKGLDREPLAPETSDTPLPHEHIRGPDYFH